MDRKKNNLILIYKQSLFIKIQEQKVCLLELSEKNVGIIIRKNSRVQVGFSTFRQGQRQLCRCFSKKSM